MKITCLLLLTLGILTGCDHFQANGQAEKPSQNTASADTIKIETKTPDDKILFKGDSMTVMEVDQSDLKQLGTGSILKKSCLNKVDENIKKNLSAIGFRGDTQYQAFETKQTYSSGPDKLTVNIEKELFLSINPSFLKKMDEFAGSTITRNLYLIKSGSSGYLLLIGPESATSGMGHLYRSHLLVSLDPNRPTTDFESISDDPRRIRISDSGSIYYTQIDPPYHGAVKGTASKSLRLTVSLFKIDNVGKKTLETKFDLGCSDVDKIFDES